MTLLKRANFGYSSRNSSNVEGPSFGRPGPVLRGILVVEKGEEDCAGRGGLGYYQLWPGDMESAAGEKEHVSGDGGHDWGGGLHWLVTRIWIVDAALQVERDVGCLC